MKNLVALFCGLVLTTASLNASILYGGLGGHSNGDSINDGSLAVVDQTNGTVSIVGHPAGVARISGLVFDNSGALFATTQPGGGFPPPPGPTGASQLLRLNPSTGAIQLSVAITDGTNQISIADLALNPLTGALYGIRGPVDQLGGQGKLYTINPVTGLAMLVGDTGHFFGALAFAPNGTLYMEAADLDPITDNLVNIGLRRINPANGAQISFVPTADFLPAFAIRPEDGVIFGGNGDSAQLFTVNPTTGAETLVGSTGRNFIGDLAFQVPEPASLTLLFLGSGVLLCISRRVRSRV